MDRHTKAQGDARGSYSSSYSADGVPRNLQQLQTQLRRLRIDPEGSNVVMQDVTRIVSMSNRDRRGSSMNSLESRFGQGFRDPSQAR